LCSETLAILALMHEQSQSFGVSLINELSQPARAIPEGAEMVPDSKAGASAAD